VQAFLSYTLGLGVIVALGMIWEYRMKTNLFWHWSEQLLPGSFTIDGTADAVGLDNAGRRIIRGPAEVPLEAVAMLTMALPIAFVRIIHARNWRPRILYGLAVCALFAAALATYRKSALIAPVSVILTLLYFRRRELLKLAPLGMVLLIIVSSISPGAIGSTISQFTRSDRATVPTVNDRASDYDAVRPDVWTHLAFGRGWGSYNHDSYRILDSEILTRTIEGGVIGLVAFLMVGLTVVACTRKTIAARDPASAPVALVGASIAIGFLVLATLFDELSFPHAPYIFLYMVGLVAVAIERRGARAAPDEWAEDALPELYDYEAIEEREPEGALVAQAPLVPMR
jgi:O-antigen ligase